MRIRGLFLTLITSCIFGSGAVLTKIVVETFNPLFLSWLALFCGGLCVTGYLLIRRKPLLPPVERAVWIDLFLLGSIGTALPMLLGVAGLAQTSAITGGFLLQLQGPAAIILALVFLKEKVTWKQVTGIILLLVGSVLVLMKSFDLQQNWQIGSQGDLLLFLAAIGYGASFLFGKRLAVRTDPLQTSAWRLIIGAVLLTPVLFFQFTILHQPLTWPVTAVLVIYIVSNFGIAYFTQQMGWQLIPAWEAAAIMQTMPLFSILFALLLLQDSLTLLQIIGGVIALAGGLVVALNDPSRGIKRKVAEKVEIPENSSRI